MIGEKQKKLKKERDIDVSGEIDLAATIIIVLRGWWVVLIVLIVCLVIAADHIYKFKPSYVASMVVAPAESAGVSLGQTSRERAAFRQVFSGFGAGGESANLFDQFTVILSSKSLAERVQSENELLQLVFRDAWDAETKMWKRPNGWVFRKKEELKKKLNMPEWRPPNLEILAQFVKDNVAIEKVLRTNLYKLSVESSDPVFAADLLKLVVFGADDILRERDYKVVASNLTYIRGRLNGTTISEYRLLLIQLLAEREQRMMLMQGPNPYAFQIVEKISIPETPSSPKAIRTIFVAIVAGIIVGIVLTLILHVILSSFRARRYRILDSRIVSENPDPHGEIAKPNEMNNKL